MTDADLATLCAAAYRELWSPTVAWDHYDDGAVDGVRWGLKDGVVALPGSLTFRDWLLDIDTIANPFHHDGLGPVHPGFLSGMATLVRELDQLIPGKPVTIVGHSLGAGRAALLCGLLAITGKRVSARVVFGEPKPGFDQLARLISHIPGRSYRNGDALHHDLVTDVPFSFPPEEFIHPTPIIPVCEPPASEHFGQWGIFAYHHMPLYLAAMTKGAKP